MYSNPVLSAAFGLALSLSHSCALAVPHAVLRPRQNGGQGPGGGSPGSIQKEIWIPLVVIAVLFVAGAAIACSGRRLRRGVLLSWGNSAAQAAGLSTGSPAGTTTLTAEQLAGTTTTTTTTTAAAAAAGGTNRGRRPRRTRRTPSQISTHSLPAYNKEPGEQEIVIVRGEDSDDEIPVTMPPLEEHAYETPGSFELTRTSYSPIPNTRNNVPLLRITTRNSTESNNSSAENSSQHYPDDDAPAYETVVLNDIVPPRSPSPNIPQTVSPTSASRSPSEQQPSTVNTRRRSMFSSLFNPRGARTGTSSSATSPEPRSSSGHMRDGSDPSVVSVSHSSNRILRHQPSLSSGSMLSLLRTRSNLTPTGVEGLTSPSMISLHSISSPLVHTARKTELVYGKLGPTADQIRLLSNRESIARFGMPYGDEAIAHAASTSAIGLPPPTFDEVVGSNAAGTSSSPPPPRGDTPSSGLVSPGEEVGEEHSNIALSSEPVEETAPALHTLADVALGRALDPVNDVLHSSQLDPEPEASIPATSAVRTDSPKPSLETPSPQAQSSMGNRSPIDDTAAATASPPVPATTTESTAAAHPSSHPPPSAFKAGFAAQPASGSLPARAASRASSYMSYATAAESLHSPSAFESQFDLNGYESAAETPSRTPTNMSAPPTPRLAPRHAQEGTDTTITPGR